MQVRASSVLEETMDDEPADVSLSPGRIQAQTDRGDMHAGLVETGPHKQAIAGYASQDDKAGIEPGRERLAELKRVLAEMARAPGIDGRQRGPGATMQATPIVQDDERRHDSR